MRKFLIAAALVCGSAFPAAAADAVVEEAVVDVMPAFVWTGGYIGLQAGYLWGDSHIENVAGQFGNPEPDGWLGGIYAGYNYQMPSNVVLGVDADITYNDADAFGDCFNPDGTPAGPGNGLTTDVNWSGAVRGRLGYAVDRFLPYLAGGVAFADVDYELVSGGVVADSTSDTMVGWTIGAGVEYAFTDAIIGRFEYRYTDFGDTDFTLSGAPTNADLTSNDIRFGVAWKF